VNVVYAASEFAPFAKTGGLADVAAALPRVLAERGVSVTVMLPLYRSVGESGIHLDPLDPPVVEVPLGPHQIPVGLEGAAVAGGKARLVCLRYDPFFDRPGFYGQDGLDYPDNALRFGLFARGVIAAARALGLEPDIYHLNDWQTALAWAHVKTVDSQTTGGAKTLLTIHNIGYQGRFWKWDMPWTGLDWSLFNPGAVEFYGKVNFLKTGIVFADAVNAVSPTYAREIQTAGEYGHGLEGVLSDRASDVCGILNGIDRSVWDPETDARIPANYSARETAGKAVCKAKLQEELGLPVRPEAPLVGSIGRLTEQKGMSLLIEITNDLLAREPDCQIVVLGSGERPLEEALRALEERHPQGVRARIGYDDGLAHRIEAGSDIFAMPSRYEPCGLNQMYSMTYGTIPVVRRTGGLADTVEDSPDPDAGTGFVFDEFEPAAFLEALVRAIARFRDPAAWGRLIERAMGRDWSWDRSAGEYVALYEKMLAR
jgi:starch synthase